MVLVNSEAGHPASRLMRAQPWCGDNIHELHAINNECLERRKLLKLPGSVGELLCRLSTLLELGECNLQTKLSEMLPLLNACRPGCNRGSAPHTDENTKESERAGQDADKDSLIHILAGVVGGLSGLLIGAIGLLIWSVRMMPNAQAQRPPPETPVRLQQSLTNYLNRSTDRQGGGSLQRSG